MGHKLLGKQVIYMRPVTVHDAFTRHSDGEAPVYVPADIQLVETPATIVGVEPIPAEEGKEAPEPNLHLAFVHPDRLDALNGSGWREAFDRAMSVRSQLHPVALANDKIGRWRELDEVNLTPVKKAAAKPAKPAKPATPAKAESDDAAKTPQA